MKKRTHTARTRRVERPRSARGRAVRAHIVALAADCTLADAETLKLRLAALLKSAKPVTIDVRRVHRIDTASLQLLAAFAHERRTSSLPFAATGDSGVFAQAARMLGLGELLAPTQCGA